MRVAVGGPGRVTSWSAPARRLRSWSCSRPRRRGAACRTVDGQGDALDAIAKGPTAEPSTPGPATPVAHRARLHRPPRSLATAASLTPHIGTTTGRVAMAPGVLPSRLAAEAGRKKAPSLDLLTGYRWPVARIRLTLPFGPTVWGSRIVDGEPLPRRHRPRHLLRRPGHGRA